MLDEAQLALMGTVLPRGRNVRRLVRVAFHLLLERGGNVGQFVYELDQVADVIAAALARPRPPPPRQRRSTGSIPGLLKPAGTAARICSPTTFSTRR
jgi:hypothetical protein